MQIEIQALDNIEVENTLQALENQPNEAAEILVRKGRELGRAETMSYAQSARLAVVIAAAYERSRRHVEAVEVLRPRLRQVETADERYWRARVSSHLGKIYLLYFADFDSSTKAFASAVADFDAAGEREWVASTFLMLGIAHRSAGSPSAAADALEHARDACDAGSPNSRKIDILASLQSAYNDLGRFDDAKQVALTALPLADSAADIDDGLRAIVWAETAVTRAALKDAKTAERYLAQATQFAQASSDPQAQIHVGLANARILDRAGKSAKAIELLNELSVRCAESWLLLPQYDVLRQQVIIAKGAKNYGAALGAMEALARLENRLQAERSRLKLAEVEVQRCLDTAQAFTLQLKTEIRQQTVALEETISKLKKEANSRVASEKRNEFLAGHDIVTSLATRRRLATKIEEMSSELGPKSAFAVTLVAVETTSGFLTRAGISRTDELLAQAANVITQAVPDAFVARFGDFSFASVIGPLPSDEIEEHVLESGEVVCHALSQPIDVGAKPMTLRASAGIAVIKQLGESAADILAKADAALLHAQAQFDSRAYVFDEVLEKQVIRRRDLESELVTADQTTGIFTVYQPLVDAQTSAVKGFESLVRWKHRAYGTVSPVEFIPLAESVGAIERLGLLIAELALNDFSKILRVAYPESYVTINVSMLQLRDTHFASNMLAVNRKTRVEPTRVVLEITESQIGEDNPTILANLKRLRLHGYRLAIDDFGTGYSSLWRLGQIDMQTIKIARELVVGAHLNEASEMLLVRAVQICHDLGRTVVAEGIEGPQERENALKAGCDQLQGYMFAKPMTAAELVTHLAWQGAEAYATR